MNLVVASEEGEALRARAVSLPSLQLSERSICDS
jgi:hypothetical protein